MRKAMQWFLVGLLILSPTWAMAWYQEYGNEISGVVAYDTTRRQPILVAYNRLENCQTASLWLDGSLRDKSLANKSQNIEGTLKVDRYASWQLSFDFIETNNWLPGVRVLTQKVPLTLIRQLRKGRLLTVSVGKDKYSWSLSGSSKAIWAAYNAC